MHIARDGVENAVRGMRTQALRRYKHFTSWLGLCPGTKTTRAKVRSGKTKRCANCAAQALRLAASALVIV